MTEPTTPPSLTDQFKQMSMSGRLAAVSGALAVAGIVAAVAVPVTLDGLKQRGEAQGIRQKLKQLDVSRMSEHQQRQLPVQAFINTFTGETSSFKLYGPTADRYKSSAKCYAVETVSADAIKAAPATSAASAPRRLPEYTMRNICLD